MAQELNWYMGAVSFASSTFLPLCDVIWCTVCSVCVCVFVRLFCVVYVCLCQHVFVITEGHGLSPTCRWLAFTCELLFWGSTKPTHPTGLITVFICFSQKKYSIHNIVIYNLPYIYTFAMCVYICTCTFVRVRGLVLFHRGRFQVPELELVERFHPEKRW